MQALENDTGASEEKNLEEGQEEQQEENLDEGQEEQQEEGKEGEGEKEEPITYTEKQQAHMNGIIGTKVAATHVERTRADNLQLELDTLKKQMPVDERPTVPDLPDPLTMNEVEFAAKIKERDTLLIAQQTFDNNERNQSEAALQTQQTQQAERAKLVQEKLTDYSDRSVKLGIKPEALLAAGQTIAEHGLNIQTQGFILDQTTGPQITMYLAKNPQVLSDLAAMSPMDAAVKISTEIKGLASKVVKQTDLLEDPAESLDGQGSQAGQRGPKGAKFE